MHLASTRITGLKWRNVNGARMCTVIATATLIGNGASSRPAPVSDGTAQKETVMLQYAAIFLVIAIIAAVFGFGGIAAGAAEIAKILFFIFLIIFVATLIVGLIRR